MGHPDTDEVGGHDRDILWAILGYDDLSLPSLRMDNGKSGCFSGIWACFLGLQAFGFGQAQESPPVVCKGMGASALPALRWFSLASVYVWYAF